MPLSARFNFLVFYLFCLYPAAPHTSFVFGMNFTMSQSTCMALTELKLPLMMCAIDSESDPDCPYELDVQQARAVNCKLMYK